MIYWPIQHANNTKIVSTKENTFIKRGGLGPINRCNRHNYVPVPSQDLDF